MIYIDLYSVHVLFSSYIAYIWPVFWRFDDIPNAGTIGNRKIHVFHPGEGHHKKPRVFHGSWLNSGSSQPQPAQQRFETTTCGPVGARDVWLKEKYIVEDLRKCLMKHQVSKRGESSFRWQNVCFRAIFCTFYPGPTSWWISKLAFAGSSDDEWNGIANGGMLRMNIQP